MFNSKRLMTCLLAMVMIFATVIDLFADTEIFICTNGNFKKSVGEYGGQCVIYVREETKIEFDGFYGEAWTCFQKAKEFGYAVGQEPRISAIVVFGKNPNVSGDVGHVGIIIEKETGRIRVHDSNWRLDEKIQEHWMNLDDPNHPILGYIYCEGDLAINSPGKLPYRLVGNVAWYPPNKSCIRAEKWRYYNLGYPKGGMSLTNCDICYQKEDEMIESLGGINSNWAEIIFGNSDLGETAECK